MRGTAPLAGKSGVTETFAGLFEFLATLHVYACPLRALAASEPIRFV